jgi:hypothetical protein
MALEMRRADVPFVISLLLCEFCAATPSYFPSVANQVLRLKGDARFGADLGVKAVAELEKQAKRVMGADPSAELNMTVARELSDPELLRLVLLAVLGNFTSAASSDWQRPCSLVVDPRSGLFALEDPPALASLAQRVVLMLLVAVQFKLWVDEARAHLTK